MDEMRFDVIPENSVCIGIDWYDELLTAKAELDMLKAYLLRKSKNYSEITRQEVDMLCAMFSKEVEE